MKKKKRLTLIKTASISKIQSTCFSFVSFAQTKVPFNEDYDQL